MPTELIRASEDLANRIAIRNFDVKRIYTVRDPLKTYAENTILRIRIHVEHPGTLINSGAGTQRMRFGPINTATTTTVPVLPKLVTKSDGVSGRKSVSCENPAY